MQILRDEWGYEGLVVSDCGAIYDFFEEGRHGTHKDKADASSAAVLSGTDLECGDAYKSLADAVRQGKIKEEDLDRSVARLLKARFELGEMDETTPWDAIPDSVVNCHAHQALALRMARESMTLLQNKNNLLPLKAGMTVALVGPNANDSVMQWGNYNGFPGHTVTLLEALRKRLPEEQLIYVPGALYAEDFVPKHKKDEMEQMKPLDAASLLKQVDHADVVIFAGGISPLLEGEEMKVDVQGFKGGDRTDIELPAIQRQLLKALKVAGKKVVFVNFSGSAVGLEPETQTCDAILQAWYPGEAGGTAVADVLYGDYNPAGRLPVTFYKNVGQLPDYEDYSMKGRTYRYFEGTPLFPFGHGLSYTTFVYGKAEVKDGCLLVSVTNTGSMDGDEVVQLYLNRPDDANGPRKTLRAFKRVHIPTGATRTVSLPLTEETFNWWDTATNTVHPLKGSYKLLYGGSSDDRTLQTMMYEF